MSGAVLLAACENDGCRGTLRYRWGQPEAPCDTCGGRCGVAVASWTGVEPAAPRRESGGQQQAAAEEPPWGDDVTFVETCRRDARLRDQIAVAIAEWMAAPYPPEDWQRANADDLTADLLPYVHGYAAEAARPGQELRERVKRLAKEFDRTLVGGSPEAGRSIAARLRAALEDPR